MYMYIYIKKNKNNQDLPENQIFQMPAQNFVAECLATLETPN